MFGSFQQTKAPLTLFQKHQVRAAKPVLYMYMVQRTLVEGSGSSTKVMTTDLGSEALLG